VTERFLNVQTSKQRGKKISSWSVDPGGRGGGSSHGTTGTMVNSALCFNTQITPLVMELLTIRDEIKNWEFPWVPVGPMGFPWEWESLG